MIKLIILLIVIIPSLLKSQDFLMSDKAHHVNGGFRNPFPGFEEKGLTDFLRWMIWDRLINNSNSHKSDSLEFALAQNDSSAFKNNETDFTITWIGHSTLLIQIDGVNILTDPVWGDRASPVSFTGPKRLIQPGVAFEDLPDIDVVIISHNHYDHLDKETIERLGNKPFYIIPLGLGEFFEKLNITNYQELDWWADIRFNKVNFVCVPAQHFSGRTMFNRDKTLWCGWVLEGSSAKIYFAGDTGYFPGFKEIGSRLGPFDIAAIPIGAYMPRWFMSPVHIDPKEAVDVYLDVKAKYFIPIHWGTFKLADEPINEPPKMLIREVENKNLDKSLIKILKHGETFVFPWVDKDYKKEGTI